MAESALLGLRGRGRSASNIQCLNDSAVELLTGLAAFNLELTINSIDHRRDWRVSNASELPHIATGAARALTAASSVWRAKFEKCRERALRNPLDGCDLGERCDKRHDIRGNGRRPWLEQLWRPAPYFAFGWAGPYIGATLGYGWGSIDNNSTRPSGVAGGFETGFSRMVPLSMAARPT